LSPIVDSAQTPGYARRRLEMMEPVSGSDSIFYRGNVNPAGVEIRGVSRSVDAWLIEDSRLSSGDSERAATKLGWLGKVEGALSDDSNGIKTGLTKLFTTADQLTADPANRTLRSQFLQAVDDVASGFRNAAGELDKMSQGIGGAAASTVADFNANLNALEQINIGLRKARPGSTNQASLMDERDRLLDKLSSQAGVSATFENNGSVTLRASGSGDLLVGGGAVNPIAVTAAADGRLSYSVGGTPLAIATGSLAGLSEAANHVADQRAELDTLAVSFAAQLNGAHQALTAAALTPEQVAAADASGSNGNMLALGAMRGATDPEARWSGHLANQAQTTASARAQNAAAETRADAAAAARDGVSEVDLDKEAAELLRFQQAYQAAARTIQVARETMQTLLNSI
jgi:flagellar hook-associated protein 1